MSIALVIIIIVVLLCITMVMLYSISKGYIISNFEISILRVFKLILKFKAKEEADASTSASSENTK